MIPIFCSTFSLFVVNAERCCAGGRQLHQNQHSEQAEALIVEQFIPKQENITESSQGNRPTDLPGQPLPELRTGALDKSQHLGAGLAVKVAGRYCVVSKNDSFVQFCFSLAPIGARSGLYKRQIAQKRGPNRELLPARSSFTFSSYFFR